MTISIVVEDGAIITDANSYVTVAELEAYASKRLKVLPDSADEKAVLLIKAADYLETKSEAYKGSKVSALQELAWPRYPVEIEGFSIASNEIPTALKKAQLIAALLTNDGFDLMPNLQASDIVTEERIGPITTKYADPLRVGIDPKPTELESVIAPLLSVSSGFALQTVRV